MRTCRGKAMPVLNRIITTLDLQMMPFEGLVSGAILGQIMTVRTCIVVIMKGLHLLWAQTWGSPTTCTAGQPRVLQTDPTQMECSKLLTLCMIPQGGPVPPVCTIPHRITPPIECQMRLLTEWGKLGHRRSNMLLILTPPPRARLTTTTKTIMDTTLPLLLPQLIAISWTLIMSTSIL